MKNSKFNLIILAMAVFLYFGSKISGKPAVAALSVALIVIAGIYRLIYDIRHGTLPWKKRAVNKVKYMTGKSGTGENSEGKDE